MKRNPWPHKVILPPGTPPAGAVQVRLTVGDRAWAFATPLLAQWSCDTKPNMDSWAAVATPECLRD
jgi:hypothetical protein